MKNKDEEIEDAIECLKALGQAWRNDWSDFDGRTLQRQLSHIVMVLNNEDVLKNFLQSNRIKKTDCGYEWFDQ